MTSPEPSEPLTGSQLYHDVALAPAAATRLVAAAVLAIYGLQIGLTSAGLSPLGAAVVADAAALAVIAVGARRHAAGLAHVGLRRAPARLLAAGALVGVSAWYVNLLVVRLIEPPGDVSGLQALVEQTPLAATLIAIGALPALVEELVFRGVFLRALASEVRPSLAIVVSASAFSLFHLIPAQMISTFGLGLAVAFLTLRARSIAPAMIAHFLNNTIAIVVSRDEGGLGSLVARHEPVALAGAAVLLAGGLAIAAVAPARAR